MELIKVNDVKEVVDKIIKSQCNNPLITPIIVFDNLNTEQWFKYNWLKCSADIYMNIKCARFNYLYEHIFKLDHELLKTNTLKKIIMDILSTDNTLKVSYIYDGNNLNQMRLYDYSKKLAELFMSYDNDIFDINNVDDIQKDIYNKVIEKIKGKFISRRELLNAEIKEINSPIFILVSRDLTNLEKEIINKYNEKFNTKIIQIVINSENNKKEDIKLISAPSKLREIEALHSEICKLVKNDKAKLSDIVVYSPKLEEYQNDVNRVFKQNDDKYPNVPFSISLSKNNNVVEVLKILTSIVRDGSCTRTDFIKIVSNNAIRRINQFDTNVVDTIINAVDKTNTYRNTDVFNDFEYLKERILLAKLVGESESIDNIVEFDNKNVPYSDIGLNDEIIVKFIRIIDSIIRLIDIKFSDSLESKFNELENILINLFNDDESFTFRNVLKELQSFKDLGLDKSKNLNVEVLMYSLNEIGNFSITEGIPFMTGVTFLNMSDRNIISSEYAFIIGFDSKSYPRSETTDNLNLNVSKSVSKIDIETYERIKNNSNNLIISYVSEDLKTGEEFFPSTLVGKKVDVEIPLDETRNDEEIYTKREKNNKEYYLGLLNNVLEEKKIGDYKPQDLPDVLNVRLFSDYLDEPLKAKANYLFGTYDDNKLEKINESFEPYEIDKKEKSHMVEDALINVFKEIEKSDISIDELTHKLPRYEFDEKEIDKLNQAIEMLSNEYKNNLNLQLINIDNIDLVLDEKEIIEDEKKRSKNIIGEIENKVDDKDILDDGKENLNSAKSKYLNYIDFLNNKYPNPSIIKEWNLESNKYLLFSENGNELIYGALKYKKDYGDKNKLNYYLDLYINSLIHIGKREDDIEYDVNYHVFLGNSKNEYDLKLPKEDIKIKIKPSEARMILNKIYYYLVYDFNVTFVNLNKQIETKYDVFSNVSDSNGKWGYYNDKYLFGFDDIYEEEGIRKSEFSDYAIYSIRHRNLIKNY